MKVLANGKILRAKLGAFFFAMVVVIVGIARDASAVTLYWDNDANAGNNNIATGAGLGGTGTWDTSSQKWFNGTTDVAWTNGNDAVFAGAAGTVSLNAAQSVNSILFKSSDVVQNNTITLAGPISVDSGFAPSTISTLSGSAGLVKNGAGALHVYPNGINNNYTGGTTINAGTLGMISGSLGALPGAPAVDVTINNNATLRFNASFSLNANRQILLGTGGGTVNSFGWNGGLDGVISGSSLTVADTAATSGSLTLTNANTYTGGTTVTGGRLVVNNATGSGTGTGAVTVNTGAVLGGTGTIGGSLSNSGVVDAGNIASGVGQVGALHVGGNYTQAAAGTFTTELSGLASHDELFATGSATLAGTLNVVLTSGFTPQAGNTFEIMTASGFGGSKFTTTNLPSLSGGLSWNVNYGTTNVVLSVSLLGDFNNDKTVDAADFVTWRKGLGTTFTQSDYDTWRAHFGQSGGSGGGLSAGGAVPEPTSLLLSMLVAALALFGVAPRWR